MGYIERVTEYVFLVVLLLAAVPHEALFSITTISMVVDI